MPSQRALTRVDTRWQLGLTAENLLGPDNAEITDKLESPKGTGND
jgi:hypothetical protein